MSSYNYKCCSPPLISNNQYLNQYLCYYQMFSNPWYLNQVFKYTLPQSTQRYLYANDYQYYNRMENLLERKIEKNQYQEYQQQKQRNKKYWIKGVDSLGKTYKYNSLTKESYYL